MTCAARSAETHSSLIGTKLCLLPLPVTSSNQLAGVSSSDGIQTSAVRLTAVASAIRRPPSPIVSNSARGAPARPGRALQFASFGQRHAYSRPVRLVRHRSGGCGPGARRRPARRWEKRGPLLGRGAVDLLDRDRARGVDRRLHNRARAATGLHVGHGVNRRHAWIGSRAAMHGPSAAAMLERDMRMDMIATLSRLRAASSQVWLAACSWVQPSLRPQHTRGLLRCMGLRSMRHRTTTLALATTGATYRSGSDTVDRWFLAKSVTDIFGQWPSS